MNQIPLLVSTCAMAFLLVTASGTSAASDDRTRLECRDRLVDRDASMKARYEQDRDREKFSVEVEVRPGGTLMAGDMLKVWVDNQQVGAIHLAQGVVDLVGEFNADTTADPDDADSPFDNIPRIGAGTSVHVGALAACDLQNR